MKNTKTDEKRTLILSLSEREEFLKQEDWMQMPATGAFISQHGSTVAKSSSGWKDLLKTIKTSSGKDNTINV